MTTKFYIFAAQRKNAKPPAPGKQQTPSPRAKSRCLVFIGVGRMILLNLFRIALGIRCLGPVWSLAFGSESFLRKPVLRDCSKSLHRVTFRVNGQRANGIQCAGRLGKGS